MLKVKEIKKEGKFLKIIIKVPWYQSWCETLLISGTSLHRLDKYSTLEPHATIDGDIELTYILRNKEDIEPYLTNNEKESIIYERLNEIQYLLKFTYSKKKIRRKVKEIMKLVKGE